MASATLNRPWKLGGIATVLAAALGAVAVVLLLPNDKPSPYSEFFIVGQRDAGVFLFLLLGLAGFVLVSGESSHLLPEAKPTNRIAVLSMIAAVGLALLLTGILARLWLKFAIRFIL